jgi:lipid II:glycine glycyltransferase (peptidoglycan interpeptide bridge formation enzyme)
MPDGLYSHVLLLPGAELDVQTAARAIFEAMTSEKYSKIFVQDFYRAYEGPQGFEVTQCETNLIDISDPGWEPPDAKIRSEIRKAEREGIKVVRFEADKHFDTFIGLMEQTERRHDNKPRYSREFFAELAQLSQSDKRVYWAHVEVEGKASASHIYLIDGDMALNWQVYFDKEFSWLKPNQYILFDTANKCRERGVTRINLGASPGEADGLVSYKEKWGGVSYRYPCYHRSSMLGKMI